MQQHTHPAGRHGSSPSRGVSAGGSARKIRLVVGSGVLAAPLAVAALAGFAGTAHAGSGPTTLASGAPVSSAAPASSGPVTSTSANPAPSNSDPVCPADGSGLSDFHYTVNGSPIPNLVSGDNVQSGDTVTASFTVAYGCEEEVSLVAYQAPSGSWVPSEATGQTVFGTPATGTFAPGEHTLTVTLPDCYFQVDFVRGAPVYDLTATSYIGTGGGAGDLAGNLITAANGGTQSCTVVTPSTPAPSPSAPAPSSPAPSSPAPSSPAPSSPAPSSPAPSSPAPSSPAPSSPAPSSSDPSTPAPSSSTPTSTPTTPTKKPTPTPTKPTKVLGVSITKTPVTVVEPSSSSLPFTGSDTTGMLTVAGALVAGGGGLLMAGGRRRPRGRHRA